mgnify:CR=1 FL=1
MKIRNIAKFKLMHIKDGHPITIEAGQEKEIPDDIDGDKIWNMLEHDKPEGDDILKKFRSLSKLD